MLSVAAKFFREVSEVRRLLFALMHLPEDFPERWDVALDFATSGKSSNITTEQVKTLSENLLELDRQAFRTDLDLATEIIQQPSSSNKPLGIVLLSETKT